MRLKDFWREKREKKTAARTLIDWGQSTGLIYSHFVRIYSLRLVGEACVSNIKADAVWYSQRKYNVLWLSELLRNRKKKNVKWRQLAIHEATAHSHHFLGPNLTVVFVIFFFSWFLFLSLDNINWNFEHLSFLCLFRRRTQRTVNSHRNHRRHSSKSSKITPQQVGNQKPEIRRSRHWTCRETKPTQNDWNCRRFFPTIFHYF